MNLTGSPADRGGSSSSSSSNIGATTPHGYGHESCASEVCFTPWILLSEILAEPRTVCRSSRWVAMYVLYGVPSTHILLGKDPSPDLQFTIYHDI